MKARVVPCYGIHTCTGNKPLSEKVVCIFGLQICGSVQFFSFIKKLANVLKLAEKLMVRLIQKALNPAARWTFSTLK